MESISIGIDLGTTFSALSVYDPVIGRPQLIPNAEGERLTPSSVYLDEGDRFHVGEVAISQARRTPERVVRWVKRDMGNLHALQLGSRRYRPEEISAQILAKLVRDAEKYFWAPIGHAVITVPAYFDDVARRATIAAGKLAGLEDPHVVNEPSAAGLAYGLQDRPGTPFLVFDLGGGTFDVSVMRAGTTDIETLSVAGDRLLGGHDVDQALAGHLADRFEEEHGFRPDPGVPEEHADWHELLQEAEHVKKKLSQLEEVQATVRCRRERSDLRVTRAELETLLAPLLARARALTEEALERSPVAREDIDALLLVGGSTRIPAVRRMVREILPRIEPREGFHPEEVVALGASVRAHLMTGSPAGHLSSFHDVTAHPYGVLLKRPDDDHLDNEVLIPRNARLPHVVEDTFYTVARDQRRVQVMVTQGEGREPGEVNVVGTTSLELPAGRPAGRPVDVRYTYDTDGVMHCDFVDRECGARAGLEHVRRPAEQPRPAGVPQEASPGREEPPEREMEAGA